MDFWEIFWIDFNNLKYLHFYFSSICSTRKKECDRNMNQKSSLGHHRKFNQYSFQRYISLSRKKDPRDDSLLKSRTIYDFDIFSFALETIWLNDGEHR